MCSGEDTLYDGQALPMAWRMQRYVLSNDFHNCVKLIRDVAFVCRLPRMCGIHYSSLPVRTRTCVGNPLCHRFSIIHETDNVLAHNKLIVLEKRRILELNVMIGNRRCICRAFICLGKLMFTPRRCILCVWVY